MTDLMHLPAEHAAVGPDAYSTSPDAAALRDQVHRPGIFTSINEARRGAKSNRTYAGSLIQTPIGRNSPSFGQHQCICRNPGILALQS